MTRFASRVRVAAATTITHFMGTCPARSRRMQPRPAMCNERLSRPRLGWANGRG